MDRITRALSITAQLVIWSAVGWIAGDIVGHLLVTAQRTARGLLTVGDELHAVHIAMEEQTTIAAAALERMPIPMRAPAAGDQCAETLTLPDDVGGAMMRCTRAAGHQGPHTDGRLHRLS